MPALVASYLISSAVHVHRCRSHAKNYNFSCRSAVRLIGNPTINVAHILNRFGNQVYAKRIKVDVQQRPVPGSRQLIK
jgi:hypothetical protein